MHEFTVWAPRVSRIAVKIGDALYPMTGRDERGWWNVSVEQAEYGMD